MKILDEMIAVMQAAKEGKQIEYRHLVSRDWRSVTFDPSWNWIEFDYRVKPEPKIVPFTYEDAEQLIGKAVKSITGDISIITDLTKSSVWNTGGHTSYEKFLECYVFFPSGKPCGKEITE